MSKFIVHEDSILYTSYGDIYAHKLYNAYKNNELDSQFKMAGFKPYGEETGSIISIKEVESIVGNELDISGVGLQSNKVIIYPGQKLMDCSCNYITTDNIHPDTCVLSFNGVVQIKNIFESDNEEIKQFYIIEMEDKMKTLFVSNMIMFSWEDSHQDNPFLENIGKE